MKRRLAISAILLGLTVVWTALAFVALILQGWPGVIELVEENARARVELWVMWLVGVGVGVGLALAVWRIRRPVPLSDRERRVAAGVVVGALVVWTGTIGAALLVESVSYPGGGYRVVLDPYIAQVRLLILAAWAAGIVLASVVLYSRRRPLR